MKKYSLFCIALIAYALPKLAFAAAPRTFAELVYRVVEIMNYAIGTLIVLGIVIYFFGAANHLYKLKAGGEVAEMRNFLLMGIAVLFVMVSVWGILTLLANTLLSGDARGGYGTSATGEEVCLSTENCLD